MTSKKPSAKMKRETFTKYKTLQQREKRLTNKK